MACGEKETIYPPKTDLRSSKYKNSLQLAKQIVDHNGASITQTPVASGKGSGLVLN